MNGSGDRIFAPLLENDAVAALPAVSEERVLLMEGRKLQALGVTATIEGRDELAAWLSEEGTPAGGGNVLTRCSGSSVEWEVVNSKWNRARPEHIGVAPPPEHGGRVEGWLKLPHR